MAVDRGWAARVGATLAAMQAHQATAESEAWRALHGDQTAPPPPLDTRHEAVLIRKINRIALAYGWQSAVAEYLDSQGAGYLTDLPKPHLERLSAKMEAYVEAAELGFSPINDPPPG